MKVKIVRYILDVVVSCDAKIFIVERSGEMDSIYIISGESLDYFVSVES